MQPARRLFRPSVFVCRRCCFTQQGPRAQAAQQQHHTRRAFSGSVTRHAAPTAPSRSGLASLTSRKLISISGPDAAKYLQGVITANVFTSGSDQHVRTDAGFYAAFLTAQGRILHDVFVYPDVRKDPRSSFLIEVDASEAERLQKHIKRYKLRAKFDVRVLDEAEGSVWHAWDDDASNSNTLTATTTTSNSNSNSTHNPAVIIMQDTRAPGLGHRIINLSPSQNPSPDLPGLSLLPPQVPEESYLLRRYLFGVPEGQAELLREQALPHESNVDVMGGVDFRKGCYVGQELTIRTEHRGVVRKRVLPCLLYGGDGDGGPPDRLEYRPAPATGNNNEVTAEMVPCEASIGRVGKKGRSAGKWLKGVGNLGLALCRLEIMTDLVLPGEPGGTGFDAGDEFVVALGDGEGEGKRREVKVKAFVPDWLRARLRDKEGSH